MAIHTLLTNSILSRGFTFVEHNIFTEKPAYVKQIQNIESPDGRKFYNCTIVLETDREDNITFRIMRYHTITEQLRDITRIVFPGAYQFIDIRNINVALTSLTQLPFTAATQYAL